MKPPFSLLLLFAALVLTSAAEGPEREALQSSRQSLFEMIVQGGWAMWPLGTCSLALLFLTVFGYLQTAPRKFLPTQALESVESLLRERRISEARDLLRGADTVYARVLFEALAKVRPRQPDGAKAKVEAAAEAALEAEESTVSQWINYLNVVATVAPMIGLLGTVSGMISAFQVLARGGMGRPELLAGDIGEALITTAAGLSVGIPAMVCYFVLRNRLSARLVVTVRALSAAVDALDPDESPQREGVSYENADFAQ